MTKTLTNITWGAAGAVFLVLIFPALQAKTYILNDLINFHIPMRMFYQDCLVSGDSFLWFSNIFCGYYIHGEGQVGMYHPLHLFLYYSLPLSVAFNVELFIHYPLMFFGTYFLAKRWQLERYGAVFTALIFTFSGYNLMHIIHINSVAVIAHIPWLLLCIDIALNRSSAKNTRYALTGIIVLTSSQILLGHPQSMSFSLFSELVYVLWLLPKSSKKCLLWVFIAKMLAVAVGGVQLLPTWDAFSQSFRSDAVASYATIGSIRWSDLSLFFAPFTPLLPEGMVVRHAYDFYSNGHEFALYCGSSTLLLISWLFLRYKHFSASQKKAIKIFTCLMILSLMMAMGKNLIVSSLPIISKFKYPVRYVSVTHLCMAVLAGISLVDFVRFASTDEHISFAKLWPMFLMLFISTGIAMWALQLPHNAEYGTSILMGPLFMLISLLLLLSTLKVSTNCIALLVVFTAFELGLCSISYIQVLPTRSFNDFKRDVNVDTQLYRWDIRGNANLWAAQGLRCFNGYTGLRPKFSVDPKLAIYKKIAGVSTEYIPRWQKSVSLSKAQPRVRLVTNTAVSTDIEKDLNNIDISTTAIVNDSLTLEKEHPIGKIKIVDEKPGYVKMSLQVLGKQLVVFSERFHSGWMVKSGDKSLTTVRVYGDFLGCVVDKQNSEIEFSFSPKSYHYGKWISVVGLLFSLLFILMGCGNMNSEVKHV
ncbi:hypothetical protein [Candidatus Uabimicrobium sp. HlEnr_7]|uniref:hypothetical protein n=1 Tax=Candidatus Uabimicrobium helgolandensis TaxID=3095367 RepID=UPI00355681E0